MSDIKKLLKPILDKYEHLGLANSSLFLTIKPLLDNSEWVIKTNNDLDKIKNSEKIFSIIPEINMIRNDDRIREMFAELDTAQRLTNEKFFGTFTNVEYLPKSNLAKQPDFIAIENGETTPVEVKTLTPQDLNEHKFFQKLIDKINNEALAQLNSFYVKNPFKKGMIFIWSDKNIELSKIDYSDLEKVFDQEVAKQKFDVTIICILSGRGLWDFYL